MKRRTYLGVTGLGALSTLAGCLDSVTSTDDDGPEPAEGAVLAPPEQDLSASSHPTYGDEIPDYSVPDALSGELVSNTDFDSERTQLYTFVYTNCVMGACPALIQRLVTVTHGVRDAGYREDAAFLPFTFDPKRDTPEVLREYVRDFGVDPSAEDWSFLRPKTQEAAYGLLMENEGGPFGLPIVEASIDELPGDSGGNTADSSGTSTNSSDGTSSNDVEGGYGFTHYALILLANDQGIVERAYPNAAGVKPSRIEDDMLAVLEG